MRRHTAATLRHLRGLLAPTAAQVKNKFALDSQQLLGGYRDLTLCGVLEGSGGLRIIGEIQVPPPAQRTAARLSS
jgi:hypothetical protein